MLVCNETKEWAVNDPTYCKWKNSFHPGVPTVQSTKTAVMTLW